MDNNQTNGQQLTEIADYQVGNHYTVNEQPIQKLDTANLPKHRLNGNKNSQEDTTTNEDSEDSFKSFNGSSSSSQFTNPSRGVIINFDRSSLKMYDI